MKKEDTVKWENTFCPVEYLPLIIPLWKKYKLRFYDLNPCIDGAKTHLLYFSLEGSEENLRAYTNQFHGKNAADEAEQDFTRVFQKREIPEKVAEYAFAATYIGNGLYRLDIAPTLLEEGLVKSKNELKRLLAQGAVELDGEKVSSNLINAHRGSILKIGKRNFIGITIK